MVENAAKPLTEHRQKGHLMHSTPFLIKLNDGWQWNSSFWFLLRLTIETWLGL